MKSLDNYTGGVGVGGSNPLAPTNLFSKLAETETADYIATAATLCASTATTPDQCKLVSGAQFIFKSSDATCVICAIA